MRQAGLTCRWQLCPGAALPHCSSAAHQPGLRQEAARLKAVP